MVIGSRAVVFHGNADKTSGGLVKSDLKKNKYDKIVSIKASKSAKKRFNSDPELKAAFALCKIPKGSHKNSSKCMKSKSQSRTKAQSKSKSRSRK